MRGAACGRRKRLCTHSLRVGAGDAAARRGRVTTLPDGLGMGIRWWSMAYGRVSCISAWMRCSVGGCVLNKPISPEMVNGLMMNM